MTISKRRRQGNDGTSMQTTRALPSLSRTLVNEYYADRAAEAAAKREQRAQEPKHRSKGCSTPVQTLLQIRALREYYDWSFRQLAAFFNMTISRVHQICCYQVASSAVPKKEDAPAGAVPPDVPAPRRGPKPQISAPRVSVRDRMQGTMMSLEEVRARRRADEAQGALIETALVDPAEIRMGEDG